MPRLIANLPDHILNNVTSGASGEFKHMRLSAAVLRMRLKRCAMNHLNATEAARKCGCSPQYAQAIYRDPSFQTEVRKTLGRVFGEVDDRFEANEKSMFDEINDFSRECFDDFRASLRNTDNDLTTYQRARLQLDILDRVPESAKHTHSHTTKVDLGISDLQRAAQGAREMENVLTIKKRTA